MSPKLGESEVCARATTADCWLQKEYWNLVQKRAFPVSLWTGFTPNRTFYDILAFLDSNFNQLDELLFDTKFRLDQDEDQPIHRRRKAIGVCWCDKAAKERRENGEESLKWVISIEIGKSI